MCILFWTVDHHPNYRFIFASNRDEFLDRPTAPARFWDRPHEDVLAGTDLEQQGPGAANGTWLGITRGGRFAALTNYREPKTVRACSRGLLVRNFLTSDTSVDAYLDQVSQDVGDYGGFSLVCLDLKRDDMAYFSNREENTKTPLSKHVVYGLSNSLLASPWKKVNQGRQLFERIVKENTDEEAMVESLFDLLSQETPFSPGNDVALLMEETKESIFLPRFSHPGRQTNADYASRTSTVILVDHHNNVVFVERDRFKLSNDGSSYERTTTKGNKFRFKLSFEES